MESKKKNQIETAEPSMGLKYPVKREPKVNMFSAGAVALEDARRVSLQE